MASASSKAAITLLASKALGIVREAALLLLAATKPDAVNIYFIASQCGMGLKERGIVQLYFAAIAIITVASGDLVRLFLFAAILFPFWLWPGVLAKINDKFGLYGVIALTAAFNISSALEILALQYFPFIPDYPGVGAPIISLWLVVISSALLFGLKPVASYNKALAIAIAAIVLIRLVLLLNIVNLGDNWIIYAVIRFAELTIPQFANYQRVFKA